MPYADPVVRKSYMRQYRWVQACHDWRSSTKGFERKEMKVTRFLDDVQFYDGFPSLWYCCSLAVCNPGIPVDERKCYCGFHIPFLRRERNDR